MALTAEQQSMVDVQVAIEAARSESTIALENARNTNTVAINSKQHKLEALRMAKDVLIENSRTLPVEAREITTANITAMATVILAYINS